MNVGIIFSKIKKVFPDVTQRKVIEFINEAVVSELPDILNEEKRIFVDLVADERFYKLPEDVIKVNKVLIKNFDGVFVPIDRLVGSVDTGDFEAERKVSVKIEEVSPIRTDDLYTWIDPDNDDCWTSGAVLTDLGDAGNDGLLIVSGVLPHKAQVERIGLVRAVRLYDRAVMTWGLQSPSVGYQNSQMTFEFWKRTDTPNRSLDGGFCRGWVFGDGQRYTFSCNSNNGVYFSATTTADGNANFNTGLPDNAKWQDEPTETWTHFVWVVDFTAETAKFYVNNVLIGIGTPNVGGDFPDWNKGSDTYHFMSFGARYGDPGGSVEDRWHHGCRAYIGAVRVYRVLLSEPEISVHYNYEKTKYGH